MGRTNFSYEKRRRELAKKKKKEEKLLKKRLRKQGGELPAEGEDGEANASTDAASTIPAGLASEDLPDVDSEGGEQDVSDDAEPETGSDSEDK